MQLRHVLAVVDFSTDAGAVAAWRAAHLAWAHEAELCLLSQVEVPDGRPSSRFGATAPPARARADLLHLAGSIRDALGIRPAVIVGVGAEGEQTLRACARRADLIVAGDDRKLAERLSAQHGVAVLLARLPPGRAHRTALVVHQPALELLPALLGAARWLCKPDGIQAVGLMDRRLIRTLQASDASAPGIQTLTQLAHSRSRETLEAALVRAGLRPDQGSVQVGATAVRLLEQQARIGASVLVVGRRSQPAWMDRLWPGLARPLMDRATCDVLVLPERIATAKDARWALAPGRREQAASEGP